MCVAFDMQSGLQRAFACGREQVNGERVCDAEEPPCLVCELSLREALELLGSNPDKLLPNIGMALP